MRNARKFLKYEDQIRELRGVLDAVPCKTVHEVGIWCRKCTGGSPQEPHLQRSERSRTGQRKKWNCDAVTTVSNGLTRSSLEWPQIEARGSGLCIPPLASHWVWLSLEGRYSWVRQVHSCRANPRKELSCKSTSANTLSSWKMRASVEKKRAYEWYTPTLITEGFKGEARAVTPQNLGRLKSLWRQGLKTETSSKSVYEEVPTSPKPW